MILLAAALALAAQESPAAAQPAPPVAAMTLTTGELPAMDCTVGFERLVEQIARTPGVRSRQPTETDRFQMYQDDLTRSTYYVTTQGLPAHPSVLRLTVVQGQVGARVSSNGCGYGNEAEAPQLVALIQQQIRNSGARPLTPAPDAAAPPAPAPGPSSPPVLRGSPQ